jgi:hypothetical protein
VTSSEARATSWSKCAALAIRSFTINGKAELVVQDAAAYQKLLDRLDELEALEGIKRGLADVKAGRVTLLRDFERAFRKKHGLSGLPR